MENALRQEKLVFKPKFVNSKPSALLFVQPWLYTKLRQTSKPTEWNMVGNPL